MSACLVEIDATAVAGAGPAHQGPEVDGSTKLSRTPASVAWSAVIVTGTEVVGSRGVDLIAVREPMAGGEHAAEPSAAQPARPRRGTCANALTAFRCVLVPVFAWMLLAHPADAGWRIGTAAVVRGRHPAPTASTASSPAGTTSSHVRQARRPDRRQGADRMAFIGLSILGELPWWVTVHDPRPRVGHHAAAFPGAPVRRDGRQPGRQDQDGAAGGRVDPVPAAAADVRSGALVCRHRDGRGLHRHGADRSGLHPGSRELRRGLPPPA